MSSSASSSTAGNNAAGAGANQGASATDGSGHGSGHPNGSGAEGNVVEKQQNGAVGGGVGGGGGGGGGTDVDHVGTEPHTSSSAHHRQGGAGGTVGGGGTTTSTTGTVLRRKTNVCLICGIYTNLSLNIFEPRNGPNIVDVIYEKYKFRAERGDNADKHICFSCNNWLINWYSLQNTSSGNSRAYEPAPSTSRSSSSAADSSNNRHPSRHHAHKPRTKPSSRYNNISAAAASSDKENCPTSDNADQHEVVSSTTNSPGERQQQNQSRLIYHQRSEVIHPYVKKTTSSRRRFTLKENNGQRVEQPIIVSDQHHKHKKVSQQEQKEHTDVVVSSSTEQHPFDPYTILVKPFESQLIRMLEGQGTSVTKENVTFREMGRPWMPRTVEHVVGRIPTPERRSVHDTNGNAVVQNVVNCGKEIVISFDSALSEVIDVVPSLKAIPWQSARCSEETVTDPVRSLRQRLSSGALTVSVIGNEGTHTVGSE